MDSIFTTTARDLLDASRDLSVPDPAPAEAKKRIFGATLPGSGTSSFGAVPGLQGLKVVTDRFLTDTVVTEILLRPTRSRSASKLVKRLRKHRRFHVTEVPKETIYQVGDTLLMHPAVYEKFRNACAEVREPFLRGGDPYWASFERSQSQMRQEVFESAKMTVSQICKAAAPENYRWPRFEMDQAFPASLPFWV